MGAWQVRIVGAAALMMVLLAAGAQQAARAEVGKADKGVYPEPALPALPSAGGKFTDPTFGTTILRVTDEDDGSNCVTAYSYWPTFNSDSTRLHVSCDGTATMYTFDPVTFTLGTKSSLWASQAPGGGTLGWEDAIWSGSDPDVIYGHKGLELYSYNVSTDTYTLIKDFSAELPGDPEVGYIGQMSKSTDDTRFSFTLKAPEPSYAPVGYIAWDRGSDDILRYEATTQLDEVQLDKTGRYLLIKTGMQGAGAIEVRVADFLNDTLDNLTDDSPDYAPGHSDCGQGTVVGADNWRNAFTFRELDTPHQQDIILSFGTDWSQGKHLSMLADDEDWALISAYGDHTAGLFHNEIFLVSTDGEENVLRLAHHRSVYDSYWDSPRANISRDGLFVAFTSNWGDSGRRDVFIVGVPEPASLALVVLGLGGLAAVRARRRRT